MKENRKDEFIISHLDLKLKILEYLSFYGFQIIFPFPVIILVVFTIHHTRMGFLQRQQTLIDIL